MIQIKKYMFGFDYIRWENTADSGVSRVFKLPDGRVVYWRYKQTKVLDEITDAKKVFWLTCPPSKYGF